MTATPERPLQIGFTGTRAGLTDDQARVVRSLLHGFHRHQGARTFHHGDCVGADDQAATIAHELGYRVVVHPPTNRRLRAWAYCDESRPPRRYLVRNRAIVVESDRLIGCPDTAEPRQGAGSGTWSTIHAAGRMQRPVNVVAPDGHLLDIPLFPEAGAVTRR